MLKILEAAAQKERQEFIGVKSGLYSSDSEIELPGIICVALQQLQQIRQVPLHSLVASMEHYTAGLCSQLLFPVVCFLLSLFLRQSLGRAPQDTPIALHGADTRFLWL